MSDLQDIKLELLLDQLLTHGRVEVKANGYSMEPNIHIGEMLLIEHNAQGDYQEGEVVAFVRDKLIFIHRLIRIDHHQGIAITKGDNLENTDEWISSKEIIGKISKVKGKETRDRRLLKKLIFRFYRFSMTFMNPYAYCEDKKHCKIHLKLRRFKFTRCILRCYKIIG